MEMAKVTSKGQITIPVSVRRRLGINEGDKLLFIDRPEGVIMVNPDMVQSGETLENTAAVQESVPIAEAAPVAVMTATEFDTPQKDLKSEQPAQATAPQTPLPVQTAEQQPFKPAASFSRPPAEPAAKPSDSKSLDIESMLREIRSFGSRV